MWTPLIVREGFKGRERCMRAVDQWMDNWQQMQTMMTAHRMEVDAMDQPLIAIAKDSFITTNLIDKYTSSLAARFTESDSLVRTLKSLPSRPPRSALVAYCTPGPISDSVHPNSDAARSMETRSFDVVY